MFPIRRAGTAAALALAAILAAPPLAAQIPWHTPPAGYPRTAAERNGFTAHTRHLEMWAYLEELRAVAPAMRLGTYGETREGRELPYAIFSRPLVSEPWEAQALGRPIVVLASNVHGGERTFREGLLVLMRDFATPGTEAWELLDDVTVIVVPQLNPDGFEASEGGQRGNAWGIDLNRDYVKLEHPSIVGYVQNIIGAWRPHIFVDGHNGGSRPYNLNYQCASIHDAPQELTLMCDRDIFPAIDARLGREEMLGWYYQRGDERAWYVGGWQARIGRNYGGMINSIGILFEAPAQELEVGARAGYLGFLAVVDWAARNSGRLMGTIERARAETIALGAAPSGRIAVAQEYAAEDDPVDYLLVREAGDGGVDTVRVAGAALMKKPVATAFRDRPWAYVLPRDADAAVAMLRRHGITVERLSRPAQVDVQLYTVANVTHERAYNHAAATVVEVGEVVERSMELPSGTYIVPTAQSLGRLVAHMLEVETEDNVIYWNTMDAWLPRPGTRWAEGNEGGPPLVPIYKIMSPTPLPSRILGHR